MKNNGKQKVKGRRQANQKNRAIGNRKQGGSIDDKSGQVNLKKKRVINKLSKVKN